MDSYKEMGVVFVGRIWRFMYTKIIYDVCVREWFMCV
jgi:hypothetical protein